MSTTEQTRRRGKDNMTTLKNKRLEAFIDEHCTPKSVRYENIHGCIERPKGFYTVTKPMHVFKKVHVKKKVDFGEWNNGDWNSIGIWNSPAIANLIIPIGATIHANLDGFLSCGGLYERKMRASKAFVHSIVEIHSLQEKDAADSMYTRGFMYRPGKTVRPEYGFSKAPYSCASGIHFFVNLTDTVLWRM